MRQPPMRAVASGNYPASSQPGQADQTQMPGGWRPTSSLMQFGERRSSQWYDWCNGSTGASVCDKPGTLLSDSTDTTGGGDRVSMEMDGYQRTCTTEVGR
jgi:hypothetical protein